MKPLALSTASQALILAVVCSSSWAHDDLVGREKEFRYGYQVGYITAVREAAEGHTMCTKDVPLLEIIQTIGAYSKAKGIAPDAALSVKNITEPYPPSTSAGNGKTDSDVVLSVKRHLLPLTP